MYYAQKTSFNDSNSQQQTPQTSARDSSSYYKCYPDFRKTQNEQVNINKIYSPHKSFVAANIMMSQLKPNKPIQRKSSKPVIDVENLNQTNKNKQNQQKSQSQVFYNKNKYQNKSLDQNRFRIQNSFQNQNQLQSPNSNSQQKQIQGNNYLSPTLSNISHDTSQQNSKIRDSQFQSPNMSVNKSQQNQKKDPQVFKFNDQQYQQSRFSKAIQPQKKPQKKIATKGMICNKLAPCERNNQHDMIQIMQNEYVQKKNFLIPSFNCFQDLFLKDSQIHPYIDQKQYMQKQQQVQNQQQYVNKRVQSAQNSLYRNNSENFLLQKKNAPLPQICINNEKNQTQNINFNNLTININRVNNKASFLQKYNTLIPRNSKRNSQFYEQLKVLNKSQQSISVNENDNSVSSSNSKSKDEIQNASLCKSSGTISPNQEKKLSPNLVIKNDKGQYMPTLEEDPLTPSTKQKKLAIQTYKKIKKSVILKKEEAQQQASELGIQQSKSLLSMYDRKPKGYNSAYLPDKIYSMKKKLQNDVDVLRQKNGNNIFYKNDQKNTENQDYIAEFFNSENHLHPQQSLTNRQLINTDFNDNTQKRFNQFLKIEENTELSSSNHSSQLHKIQQTIQSPYNNSNFDEIQENPKFIKGNYYIQKDKQKEDKFQTETGPSAAQSTLAFQPSTNITKEQLHIHIPTISEQQQESIENNSQQSGTNRSMSNSIYKHSLNKQNISFQKQQSIDPYKQMYDSPYNQQFIQSQGCYTPQSVSQKMTESQKFKKQQQQGQKSQFSQYVNYDNNNKQNQSQNNNNINKIKFDSKGLIVGSPMTSKHLIQSPTSQKNVTNSNNLLQNYNYSKTSSQFNVKQRSLSKDSVESENSKKNKKKQYIENKISQLRSHRHASPYDQEKLTQRDDNMNILAVVITSWQKQPQTYREVKKKRKLDNKAQKKKEKLESIQKFRVLKEKNLTKIQQGLLKFLKQLSKLKVTLKDFYEYNISYQGQMVSHKPYQREGSFMFFKSVKLGHTKQVKQGLKINRFFILDFDYVGRTPLHEAVIKGHKEIVSVLLQAGSDFDAQDHAGKTPLFYALKKQQYEIAYLLLKEFCDPWSPKDFNYYQFCDVNMKKTLKRFRRIWLICMFLRGSSRTQFIEETKKQILEEEKEQIQQKLYEKEVSINIEGTEREKSPIIKQKQHLIYNQV